MSSLVHTAHASPSRLQAEAVRVLVIPGLHNSGPTHWQSWLQTQYRGALRVQQSDWSEPDLDAWAAQIDRTVQSCAPRVTWVAVAHSFGCLALARYLLRHRPDPTQHHGIRSALMVPPADPLKFNVAAQLPTQGLGIPATVIGSSNDPWMPLDRAQSWATQWAARFQNLGEAGHINTESGFGPWPLARFKVDQMIRDQQRLRRLERAHPMELSYAV